MSDSDASKRGTSPPQIPDHEMLRCIGKGAYGEVWLARNIMGSWRAVKVVYRSSFEDDRPFEREFNGIKKFEPTGEKFDPNLHQAMYEVPDSSLANGTVAKTAL